MKITFKDKAAPAESADFEACFEQDLRSDDEEIEHIAAHSIAHWLVVDGKVACEIYSMFLPACRELEPDMPDIHNREYDRKDCIYTFSTACLPKYEGQGLTKLLKAYHLGALKAKGFNLVIGHSTHPALDKINALFGAKFMATHYNWYGTSRTAKFYEIEI